MNLPGVLIAPKRYAVGIAQHLIIPDNSHHEPKAKPAYKMKLALINNFNMMHHDSGVYELSWIPCNRDYTGDNRGNIRSLWSKGDASEFFLLQYF